MLESVDGGGGEGPGQLPLLLLQQMRRRRGGALLWQQIRADWTGTCIASARNETGIEHLPD